MRWMINLIIDLKINIIDSSTHMQDIQPDAECFLIIWILQSRDEE